MRGKGKKKPSPVVPIRRKKKPGPDTPYEIMHETRALVRDIHAAVVEHGKPGGLTPQQIQDLQQVGTDMQGVIDSLNAADRSA